MWNTKLDRRTLLKLASSSLVYVIGDELFFGSKVSAAQKLKFSTSLGARIAEDLPPLDGAFVIDMQACEKMATDFGHFVHRLPMGVLIPGSVRDVQKIVRFAYAREIKIAMRGMGGAAYGQSQVENGIVIDSSTLKDMTWASESSVYLQPGALWREVIDFTIQKNKTPMILPDTIVTSVGGTLSVGGIGETSYRMGAIVDYVRKLHVIVGDGEFYECTREENSELFHGILAGMGQCGFIVGAELEVFDAPQKVYTREYRYSASDSQSYFHDYRLFAETEKNGAIGGHFVRDQNGVTYTLVVQSTYWGEENPSWVEHMKGSTDGNVKTWSYYEYAHRNTAGWDDALKKGLIDVPHPYLSFFVSDAETPDLLKYILETPAANLGASKIAFFPMVNSHFNQKLQMMPEGDFSYHIRLYRIVRDGEKSANHMAMLQSNKSDLVPKILNAGGKLYLPFSPLLDRRQRVRHFGQQLLKEFRRLKFKYDPKRLLTPGAGLFKEL